MAVKFKGTKKTKRDIEEDEVEEDEIEGDESDEEDEDESDEFDDDDDESDESNEFEEDEEEADEEEVDDEEEEDEPPKKKSTKKKKTSTKKKSSSKKKSTGKKSSKKTSTKKKLGKKKGERPSFLKRGKAKAAALQKDEARAKARDVWRFFINQKYLDEDYQITFLDGELDEDGDLDAPVYQEHSMKIGGKWTQFASCQEEEPDPLQEAGKEPYIAQAFTIIDHNAAEVEDDDGNVYPPKKKLLVVKRKTMKQFLKIAKKRKGLKGCTFTVSRTSDTSANVGDMWDFDDKSTIKQIRSALFEDGMKKEDVIKITTPFDYDEKIPYYTADELIKMGLVEAQGTISSKAANEDADDIDSDF